MSKRNSQSSKTAARERLRQERERQAKRAKAKRQIIVAGSVVAVLAAAGGIGYAVVQANKPSHWEAAKDDKVVAPANTTGTDGTTVVIGKADAKKTLKVYEDSRCPICAQFEQTVGSTVKKDIDGGKYKIQYIGATFIDNKDNGEGSKNALSALGAALNVSDDAFLQYKTALYSTKWHPDETTDKFKDDSYLIKVAQTVPALKNNTKFQDAVKKGTYDAWAMAMSKTFDDNKDGVQGTPSFVMNGKQLTTSPPNQAWTVAEYNKVLDAALKA
ncbi:MULTISPECIES: thioredoxin domain-containing protein [unclassified Streptomyces]|uniref:thioredoxin domain-containing protein n=1 Tax=unclassified Streptomyces TaxID=2593676 RepID=UPI002251EBBB|nr:MULTISPECIES: thioredoxin domain-containing protein [unclassified Streptomyces]MCX5047523.1 DsbA family protein [Streptomyces sp. NBC_00474]MCX5057788.1 DsbA family protein [Streptomyces sp. NBC_00452]MCX5245334.1 DsbA family protein [Streptomyces sp. NBC_00201]MCX5288888.1 DsbA family protein [Streptomyces sp. NBC_00183]